MLDALLLKALVLIGVAALFAWGMARLRLPVVLGYLAAGLVVGPLGLSVLSDTTQTEFLAELGVIFLMFMVGLEFRLSAVLRSYRSIFLPGLVQVGLTTLIGVLAGRIFGFGTAACALLGGAVAMSSTALVTKQLDELGEIDAPHARRAVGILVFQDLASLPFLILVESQRVRPFDWPEFLLQLAIAVIAFFAIAWLARPVFRLLVAGAARSRSNELLILIALMLAIGTSFLLHILNLSTAIGAFLAGMAVGESDYRHQIADGIKPIRDVLVGFFFVTIGMSVDPMSAVRSPLVFLTVLLILIPGKFAVTFLAGLLASWQAPLCLRTGLMTAQGGEIGLLLMTQAISQGAIAREAAQPGLVAIVISMALGALVIQRNQDVVSWFTGTRPRNEKQQEASANEACRHLQDHVVLCGCGRIGRLVALVLELGKVPYVAIERDHQRFRIAKSSAHNVVFGDASRKALLVAAGIARARAVVVTFDHRSSVERILHFSREAHAEIPSIVSVRDDATLRDMAAHGTTVLPENFAAGFELAAHVLASVGLRHGEAMTLIHRAKAALVPSFDSSTAARR